MSVDKNHCMSSYLAFRYIEDDDKDFYPGLHHSNITPVSEQQRIYVHTARDIDQAIGMQMTKVRRGGVNLVFSCPAGWTLPSWRPIWAGAMPILSAF